MGTKIEWADESWNVITGCSHAGSPGCDHCYARRMAKRLAGRHGYPEKPHEFQPTLHWDKLYQPLHWRKPRVVFVCSMGDLFHEGVMDHWRGRVWEVMWDEDAQAHTFLVLTKRPKVMAAFVIQPRWGGDVPPNVWLGVSVETQGQMWRVEELVKIPAARRFANFGPLLGPIVIPPELLAQLDGVATEGESGPGARLTHPDWLRGIRDQCMDVGVAFTFKQWGEYAPFRDAFEAASYKQWKWVQRAANELDNHAVMVKVGKKAAGRLLDGQVWDEFPWQLLEAT